MPTMTLETPHSEWLKARGIDPMLAERFGLTTVTREGAKWLAVPYRLNGETINHKYRRTSAKDHRMDTGAPLALWNADALRLPEVRNAKEPVPVVITEGEWDALTALQASYPQVVSVPNGAPSDETEDLDNAKRYDWVDLHAEDLAKVQRFIIATDDDNAGRYLRTDLVRLLGANRCSFVQYPAGCKDLNEVLVEHGIAAGLDCIDDAKEVPVQGLYKLSDIPERGEVRSYLNPVKPLAEILPIVPGTLTVLTGFANMGKSTLMDTITAGVLRNYFPGCVAAFETEVKPILQNDLACAMIGCAKHELTRHADYRNAMACMEDRLHLITQLVDEDDEMDFDRFLELCETAVRRGAKMIVLDPWNEVEHKRRRDENETDYTGRMLRAARRFAKMHDVAFWIVAHPSKPQHGSKQRPGLYDISGSANWANKPDYGVTYHRPDPSKNFATITVTKVRKGFPGQKQEVGVSFDFRDSQFKEAM